MKLRLNLDLTPSPWFVGILAELNQRFSDWSDGAYDWADQTTDFLHAPSALPAFDDSIFETPLSRQAVTDLLQVTLAIVGGDHESVRRYLEPVRFAFVIGYPRSGGSYLTKEILRTIGLDHTKVSEALAHDGFPEVGDIWFPTDIGAKSFYMQDTIFQIAEFLVISRYYYMLRTRKHPHGYWLAPKKFHKIVNWAGSLKYLIGPGQAEYLVTVRNPLPTAISIYEKSGGFPPGGLFPVEASRSAIERWVVKDLVMIGHSLAEVARMDYFVAVERSWSSYYARLATSGLFLGLRDEPKVIGYEATALEGVVEVFRANQFSRTSVEPFLLHDKSSEHPQWAERAGATVETMRRLWEGYGLSFPALSLA